MDIESYLVGIFDGEGSVSALHHGPRRGRRFSTSVMLTVQMQNKEVPELLYEHLGGSLRGPYERPNTNRPFYQWYVTGARCRKALELFADKCLIKKRQAELALMMIDLVAETAPIAGKRVSRIVSDDNLSRREEIAAEIKRARANA